jgi:hypothetical protein
MSIDHGAIASAAKNGLKWLYHKASGANEGDANSHQVGGSHYKTEHGIEHWDLVALFKLDYFQGQITKYVMRWKAKGGLADLKKARHFLDKYIEIEEATLKAASDSECHHNYGPVSGGYRACVKCGMENNDQSINH